MDALAAQTSVERVAQELLACQARPEATETDCTYVARSVFRLLPEFRMQGALPRLEAVFQSSRSRDYDLFLLRGAQDGRAWREAAEYLAGAH
jgi:hypothetical protein